MLLAWECKKPSKGHTSSAIFRFSLMLSFEVDHLQVALDLWQVLDVLNADVMRPLFNMAFV